MIPGRDRTAGAEPAAGDPPLLVAIRLGGLALLLWGVFSEVHPGHAGVHLGVSVLAVTVVPAWMLWSSGSDRLATRVAVFAWLGLAGGALAALAPLGLTVVGVAAMGAATILELPWAVGVSLLGPAALALAALWAGTPEARIVGGVAAALAGLVLGVSRRQGRERAAQAAAMALEHDRAELEHARAAVLDERNRLAREVHDVLAHTLGALSVQLEALDALIGTDPSADEDIRRRIRGTRSLAVEGLAEARRAVRALRDDAVPLDAQLRKLTGAAQADLVVSGDPRPLPPEATLALYRVAQESLTNAAKHAPGAPATVSLRYGPDEVHLRVENGDAGAPPGELAATGAGFGLDGIRERVRLLGGEVAAGPAGGGWLVEATVPS